MSQDGQGQRPDLGGIRALRVGRLQPEMEPLDSVETDSVETDANAFQRSVQARSGSCLWPPVYRWLTTMPAWLVPTIRGAANTCLRPYSLNSSADPKGAIAVLALSL
jgi:hypothetical protein